MAWIEAAGGAGVGVACRGFMSTTDMVARFEGLAATRLVEYPPPNVAVQSAEQVYEYARELTDQVDVALTSSPMVSGPGEIPSCRWCVVRKKSRSSSVDRRIATAASSPLSSA